MTDVTAIDGRRFREVLGHYPTGVALVTAVMPDGEPIGMIVGSFTSVSLDPPLVAYLPTLNSYTFGQLREASTFVINVLSADQESVCRTFASRAEDKWEGVAWSPSPGGAPVLDDSVAWIECSTDSITEAGDHYLVMGRIQDMNVLNPISPLLFFQGGYGKFTLSSLVATSSPDLVAAIRLAEIARADIEDLAARKGIACDVVAAVGPDLVFVGAVNSGDAAPSTPLLGTRIPLMAPLGEQYVAYLGEGAAESWISRSGVTDAETLESLRGRLACARERGWTLSRIEADTEIAFYETLREYSDGDLTPAQERALRARIMEWSLSYDPLDIDPSQLYDAHSVVVPVLDRDGQPKMVIRVVNLPKPATGSQILDLIAELQKTAAVVAMRLESPRTLQFAGDTGWG